MNKIRIIGSCVLFLISTYLSAQSDTTFSFKSIAIPTTLITTGIIINQPSIKTSFQEYAPTIADFIFTISDKKKNDLKHLSDIIISEIALVATTQLMKRTINAERPNGGKLAFPSGHTTQAFTGATLLFHHYGKDRPLIGVTGFILAAATGSFRVLRNKHWVSDVTMGAGLGILIGTLTYQLNPVGRDKMTEHVQIAAYPGGISLNYTF